MSIIIRLQNLSWSATSLDIRRFFQGLNIPEGGVHIVGGEKGDAFIAFATDEDARQAMEKDLGKLKDLKIKLMLSSRAEMQRVIEQARTQTLIPPVVTLSSSPPPPPPQPPQPVVPKESSSSSSSNRDHERSKKSPEKRRNDRSSREKSRDRDRERSSKKSSRRSRSRSPRRNRDKDRDSDRRSSKREERHKSEERSRPKEDSTRSESESSKRASNSNATQSSVSTTVPEPLFPAARAVASANIEMKGSGFGHGFDSNQRQDSSWNGPFNVSISSGGGGNTVQSSGPPYPVNNELYNTNRNANFEADKLRFSDTPYASKSLELSSNSFSRLQGKIMDLDFDMPPNNSDQRMNTDMRNLPTMRDMASLRNMAEFRGMPDSGMPSSRTLVDTLLTENRNLNSSTNRNMSDTGMLGGRDIAEVGLMGNRSMQDHGGASMSQRLGPSDMRGFPDSRSVGNHRSVPEPRGMSAGRGMSDMRGMADSRGMLDPRGMSDPRGISDSRSLPDARPMPDSRGVMEARDPRGMRGDRVLPNSRDIPDNERIPDTRGGTDSQEISESLSSRHSQDVPETRRIDGAQTTTYHKRNTDPDQRTCIEMRGLPLFVVYSDIREFFRGISIPADGIKIINNEQGQRTGVAYIRFANERDRFEGLKRTGNRIDTSTITLGRVSYKTFDEAVDSFLPPGMEPPKPFNRSKKEEICVMMKGLPFMCKESDIAEFFNGIHIADMFIEYDVTGRSRGMAFAEFSNVTDVKEAMSRNGKSMGRRYIELSLTNKETMESVRAQMIQEKGPVPKGNLEPLVTNCLAVHGLPFNVVDRQLADFFGEVGYIPHAIHMMLGANGKPTGDAYIEFNSPQECEAGLKRNGQLFGSQPLQLVPIPYQEMMSILNGTAGGQLDMPHDKISGPDAGRNMRGGKPLIGSPILNTPRGPHDLPRSPMDRPRGPDNFHGPTDNRGTPDSFHSHPDMHRGHPEGLRGHPDGPRGRPDGPRGRPEGPRGHPDVPPRGFPDGPRGHPDGPRGHPDGPRGHPDGPRGHPDGPRHLDLPRGHPDGPRGHLDSPRGHPDGSRGPMGGHPDSLLGPMDGPHGPPRAGLLDNVRGRPLLDDVIDRGRPPLLNSRDRMLMDPRGPHRDGPYGDPDDMMDDLGRPPMGEMGRPRRHMEGKHNGRPLLDLDDVGHFMPDDHRLHDDHPRSRMHDSRSYGDHSSGLPDDLPDHMGHRLPPGMRVPGPKPYRGRAPGPPMGMRNPGAPGPESFGRPGCVLGATNIPWRATMDDILAFFEGFGLNQDNVIRRYDSMGRPTGDARICFHNPDDTQRALNQISGLELGGRVVSLFIP